MISHNHSGRDPAFAQVGMLSGGFDQPSHIDKDYKMQKLVAIFALLLVAMLTLNACGNDDPAPTPTVATTAAAAASAPTATLSTAPTIMPTTALTPTLASPQTATGDPAQGQGLFVMTCAACHGPKGEGVKGLGKDMTTSKFIAGLSDAELLAFVKKGRSTSDPLNTTGVDMPPKGGNPALTDEQLTNIIAYIRTIHKSGQ